MATRSRIAYRHADTGIYRSVYVHWDGSPDTRMPLLNEYWNTLPAVTELISNGDISALWGTMEDTIFYHRDRNESLNIMISESLNELVWDTGRASEEYLYIFENDKWEYKEV